MNRPPENFSDRLRETLALLHRPTPHTAESRAEFDRLCARELSRAEARRNPTPQDDMLRGDA